MKDNLKENNDKLNEIIKNNSNNENIDKIKELLEENNKLLENLKKYEIIGKPQEI